ncbi:MAG TPA: S53 family peptidase [Steroidobacteraceae bacterium]|nr:S53 family peptidase [Steroidobacteraceae bacterium]
MKALARARAARVGGPNGWYLGLLALASLSGPVIAAPRLDGGAPPIIQHATDLGPVAASNRMEITFWLKLRDPQGLDRLLARQHAGNARYLSESQIDAQYSPPASDVAIVSRFLKSKGFNVTGVGAHNLFVRASGTVDQVQRTLRVEMHQYRLKEIRFRASPMGAKLPAEIASIVAAVGGLSNLGAVPSVARIAQSMRTRTNILRQSDAEGLPPRPRILGANPNGIVYSNQCFAGVTSVSFSGNGATATYQGNRYGQSIDNTAPGTVAPCGYSASDVQNAYGLSSLYREGLDGTGETIGIVDAYGSITIARDAAVFSAAMSLPPVKLTIIGTPTESVYSTDANEGWAVETTLDVEWVHAVAPGAKIVLVIAPTDSLDDLFAADLTASQQRGVASIGNSWGNVEAILTPALQQAADSLFKLIGATGASLEYSSGDEGDNAVELGFYDVSWPASSSYVTAVGGVSMVLTSRGSVAWQAAWGTNITEIADTIALGSPPIDPPDSEGFLYGSGGGVSDVYSVPDFQRGLGGFRRQVPDVSWLADPYTGGEVIYTADAAGDLGIEPVGGTSLSVQMFSALWSIVCESAGHSLGQAAPYLYGLPPGAITDIVPVSLPNNVTGTIDDSSGNSLYDTSYLALPLQGQQSFTSALYNSPISTRWFVLMFGTDSTLAAAPGYDLATGLGTPNPVNFVNAFGRGGR